MDNCSQVFPSLCLAFSFFFLISVFEVQKLVFLKNFFILMKLSLHLSLLCWVSHSVMSNSLWPRGLETSRLLCLWNSLGKNTGVGCHALLQGIFPTLRSNSGPLHCTQILCHLSHQGSPVRSSKGLGYWDHSKFTSSICVSCLESVIVTHSSECTN